MSNKVLNLHEPEKFIGCVIASYLKQAIHNNLKKFTVHQGLNHFNKILPINT